MFVFCALGQIRPVLNTLSVFLRPPLNPAKVIPLGVERETSALQCEMPSSSQLCSKISHHCRELVSEVAVPGAPVLEHT